MNAWAYCSILCLESRPVRSDEFLWRHFLVCLAQLASIRSWHRFEASVYAPPDNSGFLEIISLTRGGAEIFLIDRTYERTTAYHVNRTVV